MFFRTASAGLILFCAAVPLTAATIVAPNAGAFTNGDTNNGFPFNIDNFPASITAGSGQRYQQVFASSQFQSGAIEISGVRFRLDDDPRLGLPFSTTIPAVQIALSTTAKPVGGLSATFGDNIGSNNLTVFSGPLSWSDANGFASILFALPFLYDPAAGNLLMDVQVTGNARSTQFDAVRNSGVTSRVYTLAPAGGPAMVMSDSSELISFFEYTPYSPIPPKDTPEPATWAMVLAGAGVIAAKRLRR